MFQNDKSDFARTSKSIPNKTARNLPRPEGSSELAELRARKGKLNKTVRGGRPTWELYDADQ